jgi:tRNA-dihydrouridine synthase
MDFYFAPMEGVGGHIFRKIYHRHFEGFDSYFTPFIAPTQNKKFSSKALQDIHPDNNLGMRVIPQVLTNQSDQFIHTAEALKAHGYQVVNLNLGCPSKTVVTKRKGSGFLEDTQVLNRFLDEIFAKCPIKISIKTRLGLREAEEFEEIMKIYNAYSLEELIIHPRTQSDYYQHPPRMEVFKEALLGASMPICYNGDIFTLEDFHKFQETYPEVDRIMLGRGVLANPFLLEEIKGKKSYDSKVLKAFHDDLMAAYQEVMYGERPVLYKMKELWFYMIHMFENSQKYFKKIKKSQNLATYQMCVDQLFQNCSLQNNGPGLKEALKSF